MSGHLHDLSPKQESLLEQFKTAVGDILEKKHDDHLLLQFLRARCFDLNRTEDMFRKYVQWRKYFPEQYILHSFKPTDIVKKHLVPAHMGYDKEGSSVRIIKAAEIDLRGLVSSCKNHDIKEFIVWVLDSDRVSMKQHNAKYDRYIETRTFIFDLKDFSIRQFSHKAVLDMLASLLKMYEANFPENLKVAYAINIPYFFAWIFNLVKSIVSEDTVKKIKIYGKDGWKEDILKLVDPEILPACYGGTLTDPDGDPECPSLFGVKGLIPTYHYLKNKSKLYNGEDGVESLTVGRRDKSKVDIYVDDPESIINWEAECSDQDLRLSMHYEKNEQTMEQVIRSERFGSIYGPSEGTHQCHRAGKYVLIFDNSYSIFRSKSVLYRINVVPPFKSITNDNCNKEIIA